MVIIVLLVCLGVFGLSFLAIVGFVIALYNNVQKQNELVNEAWSNIDTVLQQRYETLPDFIEAFKGAKEFEQETFTQVAELRSAMMNSSSPSELAGYENQLESALKTIFAVAENYPELKANEQMTQFNEENSRIADEIRKSQKYYNGAARDLNRMIVTFPSNIIANFLSLKKREYFETTAEKREDVVADFTS